MKKYFSKYLPVEGEIKEGSVCYFKQFNEFGTAKMIYNELCFVSFPQENKGSLTSPINRNLDDKRPYKLFLCTKDIQVGDKYFSVSGSDIVETERYASKPLEGSFKIIREISPEAMWVKEGDEFDEDDFKLFSLDYDGNLTDNEESFFTQPTLKIKCPTCKTYH